ncbi:C-GCAxxG-C-C family protein [Maribacter arenosus]|uniref:C_GCAxxG_C_C family protein n=1 Tax=Maribacter arenosus TaxID=1854708 RepID=A0ABR7VA11_9FLAO|nr:C-GCAxxG-C-C family protein [Maribacter arenosus]MBD0850505.1 C_GCAxxG_C_C family protein [Maribacter arenosus]
MNPSITKQNDTKKVFKECGTCSRTFAHILNREFGHIQEVEERALNPLAGGIMNQGYQCGMLWGAALAVGAEAFRKEQDPNTAMATAVAATQQLLTSFEQRSGTANCKAIIGYDLSTFLGMTKFMTKVTAQGMENSHCFNLAEQWAPEAVAAAVEGMAEPPNVPEKLRNCASEVVRHMGGSEEEQIMAAGFAGGLGLSGNACGALSAALWKKMVDWCRAHPGKNPPYFNNKTAKKILKRFNKETTHIILCSEICGQHFKNLEAHTDYLNQGGCKAVMDVLGNS